MESIGVIVVSLSPFHVKTLIFTGVRKDFLMSSGDAPSSLSVLYLTLCLMDLFSMFFICRGEMEEENGASFL